MDVDTPIFTQAELLKLVPKLTAKSLQNWISRGVIVFDDKPGKQFKRLYPVSLAVGLRFITESLHRGLKPAEAAAMASDVMNAIDSFQEHFAPVSNDDGVMQYPFETWRLDEFRRARMIVEGENRRLSIQERGGVLETHSRVSLPDVMYFIVEIDILIADVLNAAYRLLAEKAVR